MESEPGSINAESYQVGGAEILAKGTVTGSAALSLGEANSQTISNGEISFAASYMQITAEGGVMADDLTTINDGTAGALLVIRKAANSPNVTVKNGSGIICGPDRVLTDDLSLLLICISDGVWSCAS